MDTEDLIKQLSDNAGPVRRLPPPWLRTLGWFALGLPPVVAAVLVHGLSFDAATLASDPRLVVEELAVLATALAAAFAAFLSTVPGIDRRWLWVPVAPMTVWLVSLGQGCVEDWIRLGVAGLRLSFDGACFPPMVAMGVVPTIAMIVMLRRGAPMMPRSTLALAALAIAALANFGLQLFHVGDVSIMVLVWHFGTVLVISALAAWLGPKVLAWRHAGAQ